MIARVRQNRFPIQFTVFLHMTDDFFDNVFIPLIQLKSLENRFVSLDQLSCSKTRRVTAADRFVFDQMCDRMQRFVHLAVTDVIYLWLQPLLRLLRDPLCPRQGALKTAG